jgi:hypothetical protein
MQNSRQAAVTIFSPLTCRLAEKPNSRRFAMMLTVPTLGGKTAAAFYCSFTRKKFGLPPTAFA